MHPPIFLKWWTITLRDLMLLKCKSIYFLLFCSFRYRYPWTPICIFLKQKRFAMFYNMSEYNRIHNRDGWINEFIKESVFVFFSTRWWTIYKYNIHYIYTPPNLVLYILSTRLDKYNIHYIYTPPNLVLYSQLD